MALVEKDDSLSGEGEIEPGVALPADVIAAIDEILPSDDPLDRHDFDVVAYINQLFPTEQSLTSLDDVITAMTERVQAADANIRSVVRGHTSTSEEGQRALEEAQKSISQLFSQISEIKSRAEQSERNVRQITRDIKQLDQGKRNLTAAVTSLNHLHMLSSGVDTLQSLVCRREYQKVAFLLEGVMKVLEHFDKYMSIAPIKELSDQVHQFRASLAEQINADFRDALGANGGKKSVPVQQLGEACLVVNVLDKKVKRDLLEWLVEFQLTEYKHLFGSGETVAWLDCIEKRFDWLKKHLMNFEDRLGRVFPPDWEISERITVRFCQITREELASLIASRVTEVDVKLLLYVIQKTTQFESLLSRRFSGTTICLERHLSSTQQTSTPSADNTDAMNPFVESAPDPSDATNPFLQSDGDTADAGNPAPPVPRSRPAEPFVGLISSCFEPHLNIYVDSQDRNLCDLMDRFVQDIKSRGMPCDADSDNSSGVPLLPSCADLFMFYKKSLVQCSQLTRGSQLLALTSVFRKHLRQYAVKILLANLSRQSSAPNVASTGGPSGSSSSSSNRTTSSLPLEHLKDLSSNLSSLRDMASSNFLHNIQSLLREGEVSRLSKHEVTRVCSLLVTAEYCLDTTAQLSDKIKEKVDPTLIDNVDFSAEEDVFHSVLGNCMQMLVQDLEVACDPALLTMAKTNWLGVEAVGDQSMYVSTITTQLKASVPFIRQNLCSSRKYFTEVCVRFAQSFVAKFIQSVYKCRPVGTVGAEQLLLDAHSLKTALIDLPSVGSQMNRTAPASYTKVVIRGMTRAEMLLKLVMSPHARTIDFVEQYLRLLPDSDLSEFQKVLEMKGIRRAEQSQLTEVFRTVSLKMSPPENATVAPSDPGSSRVHRLEKLIKRQL